MPPAQAQFDPNASYSPAGAFDPNGSYSPAAPSTPAPNAGLAPAAGAPPPLGTLPKPTNEDVQNEIYAGPVNQGSVKPETNKEAAMSALRATGNAVSAVAPVMTFGASLPVQAAVGAAAGGLGTKSSGGTNLQAIRNAAIGGAVPPAIEYGGGALSRLRQAALPTMEEAGKLFQPIEAAAKDVPIEIDRARTIAEEAKRYADAGATMPKVLARFLKATQPVEEASRGAIPGNMAAPAESLPAAVQSGKPMTTPVNDTFDAAGTIARDPNLPLAPGAKPAPPISAPPVQPGMKYPEGRMFAQNSGRLSASERLASTPQMQRLNNQFYVALRDANRDAAEKVGMGEQYDRAMAKYAGAAKRADWAQNAKDIASSTVAKYVAGGLLGAGGLTAYNVLKGK